MALGGVYMTEKVYAIVRLRGKADTHHSVGKTLELLRLHKVNHAVIYNESDTLKGMLKKAKDKVTWGEITPEDLTHLLRKRGELPGSSAKLSDDYIAEHTNFKSIEEFAKALFEGKAKITDIPNIQPVFRLSPPKKGFKSLKNPWGNNGDLGYRAQAMSDLIRRMA
jgi:large subunit ribosomal protein L30